MLVVDKAESLRLGGEETRAHNRLRLLLLAWLPDYRGLDGDSFAPMLQAAGLTLTATCVLWYCIAPPRHRTMGRVERQALMGTLVFTAFACAVGFARGQSVGMILTAALPLLLFTAGIRLTADALSATKHPQRVRSLLLRMAVGSILLRPVLQYLVVPDFDFTNARFEILGGGLIIVLGYSATRMFAKPTASDVAILITAVALVAASVTRTYLVAMAAMCVAHVVASPKSVFRLRWVRTATYVVLAGGALLYWAGDSYEVLTERWINRLISTSEEEGFDLTGAARLAEIAYQVNTLATDASASVFGNGIAARTQLLGANAEMYWDVDPEGDVSSIGFGHSAQISILFVGGWLVGGAFLLMTLHWVVRSVRYIRAMRGEFSDPFPLLGTWGATTVIGVTVASALSGAFHERSATLFYGIALGMLAYAHDQMWPTIQSQRVAS
jgi:hypothetical protein